MNDPSVTKLDWVSFQLKTEVVTALGEALKVCFLCFGVFCCQHIVCRLSLWLGFLSHVHVDPLYPPRHSTPSPLYALSPLTLCRPLYLPLHSPYPFLFLPLSTSTHLTHFSVYVFLTPLCTLPFFISSPYSSLTFVI